MRLDHSATVYVPVNDDAGKAMSRVVARRASRAFGGATVTAAIGYWRNGDGAIVEDAMALVNVRGSDASALRQWAELAAASVCQTLSQDAAAVDIDGIMHVFTHPDATPKDGAS